MCLIPISLIRVITALVKNPETSTKQKVFFKEVVLAIQLTK